MDKDSNVKTTPNVKWETIEILVGGTFKIALLITFTLLVLAIFGIKPVNGYPHPIQIAVATGMIIVYYCHAYQLIKSVKNLQEICSHTVDEIEEQLEEGGRFVVYRYCVSLVYTYSHHTYIHYIKPNESAMKLGWFYFIVNFIYGWWGFVGIIYTFRNLKYSLVGEDVNFEVTFEMRHGEHPEVIKYDEIRTLDIEYEEDSFCFHNFSEIFSAILSRIGI